VPTRLYLAALWEPDSISLHKQLDAVYTPHVVYSKFESNLLSLSFVFPAAVRAAPHFPSLCFASFERFLFFLSVAELLYLARKQLLTFVQLLLYLNFLLLMLRLLVYTGFDCLHNRIALA